MRAGAKSGLCDPNSFDLSQDIFKLQARALLMGETGVAEALRLAQDLLEMQSEQSAKQSAFPRVIVGDAASLEF